MACLVCGTWGAPTVCRLCRLTLRSAVPRVLGDGLAVSSAYIHEAAARTLVHRLKYQGFPGAAVVLAQGMVALVPPSTTALVPVPRSGLRRLRYGVDPGRVLARTLSKVLGLPSIDALRSPVAAPRHAGRSRSERHLPMLTVRCRIPPGSILIDDVVTTGGTLMSAAARLRPGIIGAVTATSAE